MISGVIVTCVSQLISTSCLSKSAVCYQILLISQLTSRQDSHIAITLLDQQESLFRVQGESGRQHGTAHKQMERDTSNEPTQHMCMLTTSHLGPITAVTNGVAELLS